MKLPDALAARGDRLLHLPAVDSTMLEGQRLLSSRGGRTLWIVADAQTAGRGRLTRGWNSPPGNLYLTVVMDAPAPLRRLACTGYAAGLALHKAAAQLRGSEQGLRLKWPNDLLLDGAKVSGLLMEAHESGQTLAIGIGLNLNSHPETTPYPATHLGASIGTMDTQEAFWAVAQQIDATLAVFSGGEGFAAIREEWLKVAAMRDEQITVRMPNRTLSGINRGIDKDGRLVLECDSQPVLIDAGDVFPLDTPAITSHQTASS